MLVRNAGGVELISNVCRHRQALILGGQTGAGPGNPAGNLTATGGSIVCPLHRWTYDNRGQILGAPQFPSTPCLNLPRFPLKSCHGLLFEGPRDPLADLGGCSAGRSSTSATTCWTMWKSINATTTGRPSSRSTWRTTTSAPSIPAWAAS